MKIENRRLHKLYLGYNKMFKLVSILVSRRFIELRNTFRALTSKSNRAVVVFK